MKKPKKTRNVRVQSKFFTGKRLDDLLYEISRNFYPQPRWWLSEFFRGYAFWKNGKPKEECGDMMPTVYASVKDLVKRGVLE